ncbi:putative transcriptional regulator, partial [Moritella sp. PE36]|uniref:helix-turn-helix transcriptional regulator n=1 Tax=Moritella sp. PE36 TaxID=58051 RepID=UPI0001569181
MENPLALRLKTARKSAGITQQNLGIRLGMEPNTASARMNQYEKGKHTPDYQTMQRI